MLGDVLLIEEKHEKAAQQIFDYIEKFRKGKFIVAVSGESGSGKTELTHCIAKIYKKHGIKAKPVHSDNFYLTLPEERNAWREEHGREAIGYAEYDWDKIYQVMEDFRAGRKSEMPCVDIVTDQVDTLISDFRGIDVLIVDGLYAIKAEGLDLKVFIDITYHETKKAQLRRGKEPQNAFRQMVLGREHEVVSALKPDKGLIINKDYQIMEAGA